MATTSSGTITTSTVNGTARITGLSSGVDVDSIVEQMMSAEKVKLNKLKQQEQLVEWKQEAYRSAMSTLKTFSSAYLDTLAAGSITKQSTFLKYSATSDDEAISVQASAAAKVGTHTLAVTQLATAQSLRSAAGITKAVQGTTAPDYASAQGQSWTVTLDGTARTVTLDSTVTDLASLQTAIDSAIGAGKLTVSDSSGVLALAAADSGVQAISAGTLDALGFGSDAVLTNRLSTGSTLAEVAAALDTSFSFDGDGQLSFTLNGKSFSFDQSDTLSTMISEVNAGEAGVTLRYDSLQDQLVLAAEETGAGTTLAAADTEGTFISSLLTVAAAGVDAKLTLDGQALTRSSNDVVVDGVTYTLNKVTSEDVTVGVAHDTSATYEAIASFVEAYNGLIDTLRGKLTEDYDSDYPPLTDEQKEEMTDEEIENWEAQAKTGLLEGDSLLQGVLDELRGAFLYAVPGTTLTFAAIGFSSDSYDEYGKITLDEAAVKAAIQSDPEGVMNLFTKQSATYGGTSSVRTLSGTEQEVRFQEEGFGLRFYDVLQKYMGTTRDSGGQKGLLLEKAGLVNDASYSDNTLSDQLDDLQERIEAEEDRLEEVEDRYYDKYTAMETYLNKLSAQMASFSSSTG